MPSPPLLLFLDWDNTLTTTTTLPLLASIATHPTLHPGLTPLSTAYSHDLSAHDAAYVPAPADRTTVAQELTYLNNLRAVERRSVERVEAAGIFRGVAAADVDVAAKDLGMRPGCLRAGFADLVRNVQQRVGGVVTVVSVAWSRRFIRGVLLAACVRAEGVRVDEVDVRANEIVDDGSGRLDRVFGGADGGVWTAGDKARVMAAVAVGGGGDLSATRTVYVGDSSTDLACLLQADVGICIRDQVMTAEQQCLQGTLERIGVECRHVAGFDGRVEDGRKRLWWAGDFDQVCRSGVTGMN